MFVTHHALDRYREHHTDASESDILAAILSDNEISAELAQSIFQRRNPDHTCKYYTSSDFRGIFIVSEENVVITYVRLGEMQQSLFKKKNEKRPDRVLEKKIPKTIVASEPIEKKKKELNGRQLRFIERQNAQRIKEMVEKYSPRQSNK